MPLGSGNELAALCPDPCPPTREPTTVSIHPPNSWLRGGCSLTRMERITGPRMTHQMDALVLMSQHLQKEGQLGTVRSRVLGCPITSHSRKWTYVQKPPSLCGLSPGSYWNLPVRGHLGVPPCH